MSPSATAYSRARAVAFTLASTLAGSVWAISASAAPAAPTHAPDLDAGTSSSSVTDGLLLRYALDEGAGTVATDASGNGRDGTILGGATWLPGGAGLTLSGADGYVDLPDNVMAGLTAITVSTKVNIDTDQAAPYFIWGLGNTTASAGDGYLFTTGNSYRSAIATGNWSTEQGVDSGRNLARGTWRTITYTLAGGVATLYEDGQQVASTTGITTTPAMIGNGTTTANYLGRSVYSGDRLLKGSVRDFRIYDRALTPAEVAELGSDTAALRADEDAAALSLGDTSAVTDNLTLPSKGTGGSTISWSSSDPALVGADGTVTRPAPGTGSATATLTATVSFAGNIATATFTVRVLADLYPREKVAAALAGITIPKAEAVRGNITLPTVGAYDVPLTWSSDTPAVVSATGVVTRPAYGAKAVKVKVFATAQLGSGSTKAKDKRAFTLTVLPLPKPEALAGYAFTYFTGEGFADGEQIYLAASRGNDPLKYDELGGGKPILTSTLGDKGVRDPFLIRSPEGDTFYLIATDLRIYGNGNWDASQRTGSTHIEVWESHDLVNWSPQRHVQVSPDNAGNTWAPEAYWDEASGSYIVFWASKLYADDDPEHTGNTYNKMMYAMTRDFVTFTPAKVWVDPGYSVIDSTLIKDGGTFYRFTKDERNNTSSTPCSKFILAQKSTSLTNLDWDFVADCIGKATPESPGISQGEGPTIFKSNTENRWYLFIDEFGGRGYVPFETTDLASGRFTMATDYDLPTHPRHGTVLPITASELARLRS